MREFYPMILSLVAIALFGLIEILLLVLANRPWWSRRWVRRVSWGLPLFGLLMVLVWGLGQYYAVTWLRMPAATLAVIAFVLEVALMLSLPVSGVIHLAHWVIDRVVRHRRLSDTSKVDTNRRALLRLAAAGLPVASVSLGLTGVTHAFNDVNVSLRPIRIAQLPPALEGLRILHLSDSHLAHYTTLDTIVSALSQAEPFAPDLIVITGDIADDLSLLGDALKLISELRPRFGTYACLGNHEYYRGLPEVKRIFERSSVPLLINQAIQVDVVETALRIAGIDDPRHVGGAGRAFFKTAIDTMLSGADAADFTVLLSHRPTALNYASELNLDLILAGHTHGGQIGAGERSVFEVVSPRSYLWGHYQEGQSHLYTSSGVGHWFPFRLGCPAEAPIIELSSK